MENWIFAKKIDGEFVKVRQRKASSVEFVGVDGKIYTVYDLDFTQIHPLDADHKAKIDEREYWRKLRGDIALEIIRKRGSLDHYSKSGNFFTIAEMTNVLFKELYAQDKDFFKDK